LQKKYTYNTTPDGTNGGIWMSGAGPVIDDNGYIYVTTGNGTVGTSSNPNYFRDRGESILKLRPSGDTMKLVNFFTPANFAYLNTNDLDYGTDGILIIPNSTISLSGTKEGKLYVVSTDKMGKYSPGNDSVLQILYINTQKFVVNHVHGTPVYYHYYSQSDTECVYAWAESDSIRQMFFNRNTQRFDTLKTIKGNVQLDNGMPGGILCVSSNGLNVGSGIVWASHPLSGNANHQTRPGVLEAFDARNIKNRLWSSNMNPNRDSVGGLAKFNTPVVANGKVYVATFSNRLDVYGLLNQQTPNPNPVAVISANPLTGNYPLSVAFSSTGSNDPDGEPLTFAWNFGDGTTGTGATTSHNYTTAGSYLAVLTVSDAHGSSTASATISVTTPGPISGLPSPWLNADVGNTILAGSASYSSGTFSVKGSGADIWGTSDAFQFVYQSLNGNGNIVARVVNQPNVNIWAKAGVMIRESLGVNAKEASTVITPVNGLSFQDRINTGGYSGKTSQASVVAPYWVKIERSGNVFRSFSSPDGITWTKVDTTVISMVPNVYIGLCVTSHNTSILTTVTFDNVTVNGAVVTPNPNPVAVISANPLTGNYPLSVSFNSAGSNDPDGEPITYSWNFGDGTTGTGAKASHNYTTAGSYLAVLTVRDANGSSSASATINVTTPGPISGLPSPWLNADVGNTILAGSASYSSGTFSVKGSGADIWGTSDAFQFVYQSLNGNGNIVARVVNQPNVNIWAKAGVMIRESLGVNAKEASTVITPVNGLSFQDRINTGGYSGKTSQASVVAPYWVKIERSGNVFRSFSSPDGITWTKVDTTVISMVPNVYIGLCVTSHNTSILTTVTFDNVTVNGAVVTPNPNPVAVISANPLTGNYPLSVSFNSAGSNDPDGEPITYSWNFGDGTTGTGAKASHNYTTAGSYLAVLTVRDANGSSTATATINVTTPGPISGLPSPWLNADVGNTILAGSASYSSGTFSVKGTGADIWGTSDAFQFVFQPLNGNGNIVARVVSQPADDDWAKAGVMIRESLSANSTEASAVLTPVNGLSFQYRTSTGGYSGKTSQASVLAPYWVKIERSGNVFRSYSSPNGTIWTKVDTAVVPMATNTFIGLCVTSHNTSILTTVAFDNVSVTNTINASPLTFEIAQQRDTLTNLLKGKIMGIEVYPNPSKDHITIKTPNKPNWSTLKILDMEGKIIANWDISNEEIIEKDISFIKKGIYVLRLENKTQAIMRKIIKE
jgi:PKD repeat protein